MTGEGQDLVENRGQSRGVSEPFTFTGGWPPAVGLLGRVYAVIQVSGADIVAPTLLG
jgi:hypothetical protein